VIQRHVSLPNQCLVRLFFTAQGYLVENPGTEYVEIASYNLRTKLTKLDFLKLNPVMSRVIVTASGNEKEWKGVDIYDVSREIQLCEKVWSGTGTQRTLAGAWTLFPLTTYRTDDVIAIRVKGSSATEDITLYAVDWQLLYYRYKPHIQI